MINLYSVRNQKKDPNKQEQESNLAKLSPAQLRAGKDFREISLPAPVSANQIDVMNYKIMINPDEGYYRGGKFSFDLRIPNTYPHEPPKLKCETKIYHPNIDQDGNPNPEDPLNTEAAELLKKDKRHFELNVRRYMKQHL